MLHLKTLTKNVAQRNTLVAWVRAIVTMISNVQEIWFVEMKIAKILTHCGLMTSTAALSILTVRTVG